MADFVDEVVQWAAMYLSITIPLPNSQTEIFTDNQLHKV